MNWKIQIRKEIYKRPKGIDTYVLITFYSDKREKGKDGWGFGSKTTNKRMWESHFLWFSNTASTGPTSTRLHKPQWNLVDNHRLLGKKGKS